ncbi:potassium channel protein [Paenibacillus sp. 1001270B_150601_E10]|uniref:potassium channel protein n=1 Tax=Paenibacillus sp. 1001270B_150601_E10 TaxID=2787079 RepID=UPI00189EAA59|nr:potassium channel family protein [Paenibacillus sp. 1001270B_150601_E10]
MFLIRRLSIKLLRLKNSILAVLVVLFVLLTASTAYLIEPDTFTSWFNALYWVLTTMATVGYGDYYAVTPLGKLLTIFIYIFGIGLLSLVIGKIIDRVADMHRRRETGKLKFHGKQHVIILNWSRKAQYAIEELLSSSPTTDIVIVDDSPRHPYDHPKVHFVSGDPTSVDVLNQAGMQSARAAIIFADPRIDDSSLVDGKSLLIASSIESFASHVHTTVEVMLEKHTHNFRHVNVNEFILSHDAVSRLAVKSALEEGNMDIFYQLLSRQHGAEIYQVPTDPQWVTYEDAFNELLRQGATLISDRSDMGINRRLKDKIPAEAKLFVICDTQVYVENLQGKAAKP